MEHLEVQENNMKEKLEQLIIDALTTLSLPVTKVEVNYPKELGRGDYMTNVAFSVPKKLAKESVLGKVSVPDVTSDAGGVVWGSPKELAEIIAGKILETKPDYIQKIEVAGPGFINFYLSKTFFADTIEEILSKEDEWGSTTIHKGKKILVEHSSPNLFKPFHIGHVMNNAIGESITRLAKFSGAKVTAISYPSDVSLGIGKAVYVLLQDGGLEKLREFKEPLEALTYLGDCYVRGTKLHDEDPTAALEMRSITKDLYEKNEDSEGYKVYVEAKEINLTYFKSITKILGSVFDDFIYESEAGVAGGKIVRENTPAIFKESEGAFIYEGEQDGLHTRVFINKDGYPTYEAKDIGLLSLKFKKFSPDLSIFITDHEQEEYFKVVIAAAGKIEPTWQEKTIHRLHGRMSFKGQKMSSRLGGVPLAQTLIDTLFEEVTERSERLEKKDNEDTIRAIAIAALKFTILRAMAGKNINFDPETSLSFEGDSGPYAQYTAVRAGSILEKAEKENIKLSHKMPEGWTTSNIERMFIHFPGIVERSIAEWAPHHIVSYLLALGQAFNSWYAETKIVDVDDTTSPYKLAITKAFRTTMQNGLFLLGIETPEKM
jgi:arginyl-tRNA synthetase